VHLLVCIICGATDDTKISMACRLKEIFDPGSINTERRRSVLGIMLHKADSHFMQSIAHKTCLSVLWEKFCDLHDPTGPIS